MDTQQLTQIRQQQALQQQVRANASNVQCERGFAYLVQALRTPVLHEQKTCLLVACEAFAEALTSQRTNPEAYIGFAYVLFNMGNFSKALVYVKEAQRLKPDHPDIPLLLDAIQRKSAVKHVSAAVSGSKPPPLAPPPEAELDYDALYDQLELEIMAEVKMLTSALTVQPRPSRQPQQLAVLKKEHKALQTRKDDFERQLKIIDEEIDITELTLKLKPLEHMLKRFQTALQISQELSVLCEEMENQGALVKRVLRETEASNDPEDLPIVEENLELFLDQSDLFANQLDALEAKGYGIEEALAVYTSLCQNIESLQDALEDLRA